MNPIQHITNDMIALVAIMSLLVLLVFVFRKLKAKEHPVIKNPVEHIKSLIKEYRAQKTTNLKAKNVSNWRFKYAHYNGKNPIIKRAHLNR